MKTKIFFFSRIFLGLTFLVFGLNGFFGFMTPPPMPEEAMGFLGGLMSAPYFFPVEKFVEVACGIALLTGFYTPLALIVLAPITVNIFLFHMFLAPQGMMLAFLITAFHGVCAWSYWPAFAPFFRTHSQYDTKLTTITRHTFKKTA